MRNTLERYQNQTIDSQKEDDMSLLIGLFGESCFCRIRKKRPRVADGVKYLQDGDSINCISGLTPDDLETMMELRNDYESVVNITFAYKCLVYHASELQTLSRKRIKTLIQRGDPKTAGIHDDNQRENPDVLTVQIGSEFEYLNQLYTVVNVNVTTIKDISTGEVNTMDTEFVLDLVTSYLE